ncbi:terminase gpA endonuclease subunit, partial [Klebsiella pneumoniae]|nr:terminase gpA endonuclease subunit [Klebsiella pneumoniae]
QKVYDFSNKWLLVGRRWYAHKGVPGDKKPVWIKSEQRFKDKTKLFLVGTYDAKATIYTRYANAKVGPGYVHIHEGISDDKIDQMTAERAETDYKDGFPVRTWTKPRHRRNEMLDLMVYNYAVRCSVNIDMDH